MAKKTPKEEATEALPKSTRPSGTWPVALAMAAAGREDGGVGINHLLAEAGSAEKPAMTVIVKRPRARVERGGRREIIDPYVDDVLDALRALCA